MNKDSTLFVGLDLGDRWSHLTILDPEGEVVEESRVPTSGGALQRKFSALAQARVAMEVGTHSRWVSQALRDLGHEVLVANARKLRVIFDNPRKGDRADSHTLARLARLDPKLLSPIEHRSPQAQADLDVLRSRDALVRSRTLLINHVRGVVKSTGARVPSSSASSFPSKAAGSLPEALRPALSPILETVRALNLEIRSYDRPIEDLCTGKYPDCQRLRRVQGVGPITALVFVLTLENPKRFEKSREVGPALGLVPRRDQSGGQDPQLHITPGLPQGRQDRKCLSPSSPCWLRPVHPWPLWPRLRSPPLGPAAGQPWREECEEESGGGGGKKARHRASPALEDWRGLHPRAFVASTW